MTKKYFYRFLILLILLSGMLTKVYSQSVLKDNKQNPVTTKKQTVKYKVTFIELGSVRCIPCQKM